MQYGCIGETLKHSFSKEIHEMLGRYPYELCEVAADHFESFASARDFKAINVTIPYKERILPYLYEISEEAGRIGAVNTVVNRDGRLYGYNTDYSGMRQLIARAGISLCGKKVLILGTGGTSKTAFHVATDGGASRVIRVSRTAREDAISYDEAYTKHADAEVLINTTPCGMYPHGEDCPVDLDRLPCLEGVVDAVYNPLRTTLVLSAKARGITATGGLYMLVAQATCAAEIFTGEPVPEETTEAIYRAIQRKKENMVLIGMPSCGKSTVGILLAQKENRVFSDADIVFAEEAKCTPAEYIRELGEEMFRARESEVLSVLTAKNGVVLSTGGGAILRPENVLALHQNGRVYWLDRAPEKLLTTKDRPLSDSAAKLLALYEKRLPLYRAAADVRIDANGSPEDCVAAILDDFMN